MATVISGGNNAGRFSGTACPLPATIRLLSWPLPRLRLVGLGTPSSPQTARCARPPTQAPALDLAWLASPRVILATDLLGLLAAGAIDLLDDARLNGA